MDFFKKKDEDEGLPNYTTTKDNLKYGTYKDPAFQESLSNPVSETTLKNSFKNIEDKLTNLLSSYLELIKKNPNNFNENTLDFGKKSISYWIAASELRDLIYAVHKQYFSSDNKLGNRRSTEDVTKAYLKELEELKKVIKMEYVDDCREKIKSEVEPFFKKIEGIQSSNGNPGKILMQNTLDFCSIKIDEALTKMKEYQEIEKYDNENEAFDAGSRSSVAHQRALSSTLSSAERLGSKSVRRCSTQRRFRIICDEGRLNPSTR